MKEGPVFGKNKEKRLSLNYTGSTWCSFTLSWYEWLVFSQVTTVRWISVIMEEHVWRGWATIPSSVFVEMASVETPATWRRQVPQRGRRKEKHNGLVLHCGKLFFFSSQDRAVLTPVRMTACVKSSRQRDGAMFSTSTSASASPASRECTARSVGHLQMWLMSLSCFTWPVHQHSP